MNKIEYKKYEQIDNMATILKLASILFSTIIFFKYLTFLAGIERKFIFYSSAISLLIANVYYLTTFFVKKMINIKKIQNVYLAENVMLGIVFLQMIIISGFHQSPYKYLFLFIIITSIIQLGLRQGMVVATLSSIIILTIDIVGNPGVSINTYFENDLILSGAFLLTGWILGFYVKIEREHIEMLESLVNYDGLTGVHNHRFFHEALKKAMSEAESTKSHLSMLFIDIDYFKYYNDLNGHQQGDEVLKNVGKLLKEAIGNRGSVSRYGGEEFAVILPNANEEEANYIAERVRLTIEKAYFKFQENQPNGNLTVSIGIGAYPDKAQSDLELIKSADDALYRAKFFNKNRVETYTSILEELEKNIDKQDVEMINSIKPLINIINVKDRYTYGHSERVVLYSRLLGKKLGLSNEEQRTLICAAYMHDIGKIDIDKEILIKKMPLTKLEWEVLKQHPEKGVEIIQCINCLEGIKPLILHHHERYDGTGYPKQLKKEEIPFLARVLTIVDSFDAMTSNRPYNKRKSYENAICELEKYKGTQFDPQIADSFISVIKEMKDKFDYMW
ncbi:MAG: diguanylate cyclase [Cellulosilyticaceae bacterium]